MTNLPSKSPIIVSIDAMKCGIGVCTIKSQCKQPKSKNYATILASFLSKPKDDEMSKKDAIKSKINTLRAVKEMIGLFVSAFALFGALFVLFYRQSFDFKRLTN